jgi:hypothetical protein
MASVTFPNQNAMLNGCCFWFWLLASLRKNVMGFPLSSGSAVLGWSNVLSPPLDGLSQLLRDTWVDTQIVAPCNSSGKCSQNKTRADHVDTFAHKVVVLEGGPPYEVWRQCKSSSAKVAKEEARLEVESTFPQDTVGVEIVSLSEQAEERMALETKAVHLSIFVQNSCMESGSLWHRRCWRNLGQTPPKKDSVASRKLAPVSIKFTEPRNGRAAFRAKSAPVTPRELAPVTFSFTEPRSARALFTQAQSRSTRTPIVSSLRQFRLEA